MEGMMNVWGGGLTVVAGMVCANEVAVDVVVSTMMVCWKSCWREWVEHLVMSLVRAARA
jgi:hypothetical protein